MPLISVFPSQRSTAARDLMVTELARQADSARRLAIYDRESGFLAPWYMQLRVAEESLRAKRYERPLSLLVVEAGEGEAEKLRAWLATNLRATDLASVGGGGRWFLLLPETDAAGASLLAKRIAADVRLVSLAIAELGEDGERFRSLMDGLDAAWPKVA